MSLEEKSQARFAESMLFFYQWILALSPEREGGHHQRSAARQL
jgi:hypothetical protein